MYLCYTLFILYHFLIISLLLSMIWIFLGLVLKYSSTCYAFGNVCIILSSLTIYLLTRQYWRKKYLLNASWFIIDNVFALVFWFVLIIIIVLFTSFLSIKLFLFFNKYCLIKYFKYWCPRHTFDQYYFDFFQINIYNMNPFMVILEYKYIFRIFHDSFTLVCTCFFIPLTSLINHGIFFYNIFYCKFSKTFNLVILNNVLCILLV